MCCCDERLPEHLRSPFGRGAGGEGSPEVRLLRPRALTLTLSRPTSGRCPERGRRHVNRRGQALVEFAVVCLAVYLLLAAMLTFGQWLYSAQGLQQAVDVAAREISRTPLPAALTGTGAHHDARRMPFTATWTADPSLMPVRQQVFDDNMLVLTIDSNQSGTGEMTYNGGHPIGDFPIVTQQLMPLMVNDQVNGQQLLRFPGAIFQSSQQGYTSPAGITSSGYVVRIPVVSTPTASGARANDRQLVVPARGDSGFERSGLVCRECDHRLRS